MFILSSDIPITVKGLNAGDRSVVILGQMSAESIRVLTEVYGIDFDLTIQSYEIYQLIVDHG